MAKVLIILLLYFQLWQNFFQLAVAFTCQLPLQLETTSEVKRNRIMDTYGDMRIAMNSLMINKWMALGNYQSRYVPGMIGPFLKVSLLPHTSKIWNKLLIYHDFYYVSITQAFVVIQSQFSMIWWKPSLSTEKIFTWFVRIKQYFLTLVSCVQNADGDRNDWQTWCFH